MYLQIRHCQRKQRGSISETFYLALNIVSIFVKKPDNQFIQIERSFRVKETLYIKQPTSNAFPPKMSNIDQYCNYKIGHFQNVKYHNLVHLIICNHSFFITVYLLPFKTEMDLFHGRYKKITFQNGFIKILASGVNFGQESIKVRPP